MGSLSYAVGLGMAGLGQGMADVGKESYKEQLQKDHDETIMRLQAAEADKRQQSQQTFQTGQQKAEFGQQEHMAQVGATSAMARLKQAQAFQQTLKELEIAGRHQDVRDLIAGRITVQDLRNKGLVNKTQAQQKEFTAGKGTLNSPGLDYFKKPIPGKEIDIQQHRDGSRWIQGPAGELYRFDPSQPTGYADPKSFGRPTTQDTQTLLGNPLGTMPSGLPLKDYFANKFGRLPAGYLAAAEAARTKMSASQSQTGVPGANNDDAADAAQDQAENNTVLDPYGANGPPTSQPSDYEPAP